MLPKVLFGEAFSAPINGRDDGRARSKSVPDAVGIEAAEIAIRPAQVR